MDLLDLPAEILFNIWSSSIGTTTIAITARDLLAGDTSRIDVLNNGGLQLLQICKQIRAEALPLLADRTMLVIDCVKKLPSPFRPKVTLWAEFFQRLGYIRLQKGEVLNNQNHPILRIEDISNRFPNLKYLDFDVDELGFTVAELPYTTGELQELLAEPDNLITTINEYLCDRVSRLLDNIERPWGHLGGLIQKLDRNYQILVRQVLLSGSNYWNGLSGSSWYIVGSPSLCRFETSANLNRQRHSMSTLGPSHG